MDIIERLLEDAISHDEIATQCDCRPEDTVNHDHAVNAREAANEIEKLRERIKYYESITTGAEHKAINALTPNVELTGLPLTTGENSNEH